MDENEIPTALHTEHTCQSKVRVAAGEGEWFDTISGVRQGSLLSLSIFIMYVDLVIREVTKIQEDDNYILA